MVRPSSSRRRCAEYRNRGCWSGFASSTRCCASSTSRKCRVRARCCTHERSLVLVLDDIRGERLDATLRRGPCSIARFFEIALKLVDALSCVHRHHVIHRDLRPRNVVVNASTGRLQIVDFGAASELARELRQPMPLDQL